MFVKSNVKVWKNLTMRSRHRKCPVCGRMFDAKSGHITVCRVCERKIKRNGRHLKRDFT